MSQLRSEEIFNPVFATYPETGSTNQSDNNTTTVGLSKEKAEDPQGNSCSSSSSQSISSDYTYPYDTIEAPFPSTETANRIDDTDDISSSLSSTQSQYNSSVGSNPGNLSWKSVTSGSGELTSDVSCSNISSSSGSDADSNFQQSDNQELLNDNFESEKDNDQFSSDGFETENSEGESSLAAVRTFRKFVSQGSLDNSSSRRNNRLLIQSASYTRAQQQPTTNSRNILNIDQNQVQGRRVQNNGINILRRLDNFLHRMSVRVSRYHKELCIVFLVFASGIASLRSS